MEDPRDLSVRELQDGAGVLELGVSRLLEEVGVLELLEGYIINVPPTAAFISNFGRAKAMLASYYMSADMGTEGEVLHGFETEVLYHAGGAVDSMPEGAWSQVLHEEFFGALEQCGRRSRWPDVELFIIGDGRGYDAVVSELVEPTFGLSYFEYLELRHECARYAATYPGLDGALRDQLLQAQREHYARVVVEGLAANPGVEVPERYRAEWDRLLTEGW